MTLKVGIVGLPNVGKSTLFNAITKAHVEAANYPFATINPNDGVVNVPDKRLDYLSSVFQPRKTIHATIEFSDIAGLVKGASKGEGLGNKFLSHIRECETIIQVIRCFDNSEIIHVENSIDPVRDYEIINLELIFADLESVNKRLMKVETKAKVLKDKTSVYEYEILKIINDELQEANPFYAELLSKEQLSYAKENFQLLTLKDMMIVANVSDADLFALDKQIHYQRLLDYVSKHNIEIIPISAKLEEELLDLNEEDKLVYLEMNNLNETGLERLIATSYLRLGLATFFTVGEDECRAWTFRRGMKAPEAAGVIHTDFMKGFIKAEVYGYDDFLIFPNEQTLKEKGKIKLEGKDYLVKDGDIMFFKFNVTR